MSGQEMTRHDHVLVGLVFSLQAAAMQQLGKIQDPVSGEVACDLDQARATIDVLEMLKVKCRTDTPADLLRLLDDAVMNLQLNYMDEVKKAQAGTAAEPAAPPADETPAAEAADRESERSAD